jgi:hypothetical protein
MPQFHHADTGCEQAFDWMFPQPGEQRFAGLRFNQQAQYVSVEEIHESALLSARFGAYANAALRQSRS